MEIEGRGGRERCQGIKETPSQSTGLTPVRPGIGKKKWVDADANSKTNQDH